MSIKLCQDKCGSLSMNGCGYGDCHIFYVFKPKRQHIYKLMWILCHICCGSISKNYVAACTNYTDILSYSYVAPCYQNDVAMSQHYLDMLSYFTWLCPHVMWLHANKMVDILSYFKWHYVCELCFLMSMKLC